MDTALETASKINKSQVLSAAETQDMIHREQVHRLGKEVRDKVVEAVVSKVALCSYIRINKLTKGLVRKELLELGFHKAFVSQIVTASQVGDELWKQWTSGLLGFQKMLDISRGNVQKLLADKSVVEPGALEEQLAEENLTGTGNAETPGFKTDKVASRKNTMALAAKSILNSALFLVATGEKGGNLQPRQVAQKWEIPGEGFTLALTYTKPKSKEAKNEK